MSNKINKYEVNPKDKLESMLPKLFEDNKIDPTKNTAKLIFKGQILNHEKLFGEFTEENPVIIFMTFKIKTESAPTTTPLAQETTPLAQETTNPVNTQPQPNLFHQYVQSEPDDNLDNLDSVDKLRAAVMGTLVFIRSNQQLAELFNNNFETLMGVIASPQIRPLFEKLVSDSDDGNSEYLNELSESLINVNAMIIFKMS